MSCAKSRRRSGLFSSRTLKISLRNALSCVLILLTLLPVQAVGNYQQNTKEQLSHYLGVSDRTSKLRGRRLKKWMLKEKSTFHVQARSRFKSRPGSHVIVAADSNCLSKR